MAGESERLTIAIKPNPFMLLFENKADMTLKSHLGDTAQDILSHRMIHKECDNMADMKLESHLGDTAQQQEPQKPKPLKLTPAEIIDRSMVPHYFFSPMPTFLNPSPTMVLASPNMNPGTPQAFFPPELSTNHFVSVTQMPVTTFFSNGNVNSHS